jgi:hypothetical protein
MLLCICDAEFYPIYAQKRQCDCMISPFGFFVSVAATSTTAVT